jgi:hypothetical protein
LSPLLTDDWWALGEGLAELVADLSGVEPPPATRTRLTELIVELLTIVTCWPNRGRPAAPLLYLRARRARMAQYAPWLYELSPSTRKLLVGTDRLPSVLSFAVDDPAATEALRRVWRNGLLALIRAVDPTAT